MLHYLPGVLECEFLSSTPCKTLMLEERDRIEELTDQTQSIKDVLGLSPEDLTMKPYNVLDCN